LRKDVPPLLRDPHFLLVEFDDVSNNHSIVKPPFLPGLLLLLSAITSFGQVDRITGKHFATRSEVIASHGMAATAQPLATETAIDILKQGGSAVDAAIAANATLGLMELRTRTVI
jgi:hypothetical protein